MSVPSRNQLKAWTESYLKGTISEADKNSLEAWYSSIPDNEVEWDDAGVDSSQALQSKILDAIELQIESNQKLRLKRIRRFSIYISAAAAVLILFIFVRRIYLKNEGTIINEAITKAQPIKDIQPGVIQATLTLANGKVIPIDSAHSLNIAKEKRRIFIMHKNGTTEYIRDEVQLTVYNTLTTKRGEQAPPIILSDGTKVWVNAASSFRFPLSFNGSTREVMLSGEAYFEVAKDARHPFIVNTGKNKVEVLGTHFDVMAYQDEPYVYATLLKGSIRIVNKKNTAILSPGQQGKINTNNAIEVKNIDAEQSIDWLEGKLSLTNINLQAFMREISRWYNVDINYEGQLPTLSFSGSLNKNVPLSQILQALNANGVNCELKNKTIIVSGK